MDYKTISKDLGGTMFQDDLRGDFEAIGKRISRQEGEAEQADTSERMSIKLLRTCFHMARGDYAGAENELAQILSFENELDRVFVLRCQTYRFRLKSVIATPPILRFQMTMDNTATMIINAGTKMIGLLRNLEADRLELVLRGDQRLSVIESQLFGNLHTFNTDLHFAFYSHPKHFSSVIGRKSAEPGQFFDRRLHEGFLTERLHTTQLYVQRLELELHLAVEHSQAPELIRRLRDDYNARNDIHGVALSWIVEGDHACSLPFVSPLSLNLIPLTQGMGWNNDRWDSVESSLALNENSDALRSYEQAMKLMVTSRSTRGQAAIYLRHGCIEHAQAMKLPRLDRSTSMFLINAQANFTRAKDLFGKDLSYGQIVDCHQLLVDINRHVCDSPRPFSGPSLVEKASALGRAARVHGDLHLAQFMGTLILRFGRRMFFDHRETALAVVCCSCATAVFSESGDQYMKLQSLIAHVDVLEQCSDFDGALLKVEELRQMPGGSLQLALGVVETIMQDEDLKATFTVTKSNILSNFDQIASRVYVATGRSDLQKAWSLQRLELMRTNASRGLTGNALTFGIDDQSVFSPKESQATTTAFSYEHSHNLSPPNLPDSDSKTPQYDVPTTPQVARPVYAIQELQKAFLATQVTRSQPKPEFNIDHNQKTIFKSTNLLKQALDQIAISDSSHVITNAEQVKQTPSMPFRGIHELTTSFNDTMNRSYIHLEKADIDAWREGLESFIERCGKSLNSDIVLPPDQVNLYKMIAYVQLGNLESAREVLPLALPRQFRDTASLPSLLDELQRLAPAVGMADYQTKWNAQAAERAIALCVMAQDWNRGMEILAEVTSTKPKATRTKPEVPQFRRPKDMPRDAKIWQDVSWVGAIYEFIGKPEEAMEWYLEALRRLENLRNSTDVAARQESHSTIHSNELFAGLVRLSLGFNGDDQTQVINNKPLLEKWALPGPGWSDQAVLFIERGRARALLDLLVTKAAQGVEHGVEENTLLAWTAELYRQRLATLQALRRISPPETKSWMKEEDYQKRFKILEDDQKRLKDLLEGGPDLPRITPDHDTSAAAAIFDLGLHTQNAQDLYKCIPQNTVVLQIFAHRKGVGVAAITEKGVGKIDRRTDLTDIDIRSQILTWVKAIQESTRLEPRKLREQTEELTRKAQDISDIVLKPHKMLIDAHESVVIIPSQAFQRFPISAYVFNRKPLFTQKVVYQVPSLTVLSRITKYMGGRIIRHDNAAMLASNSMICEVDKARPTTVADAAASSIALGGRVYNMDSLSLEDVRNTLMKHDIVSINTHGTEISSSPWQSYLNGGKEDRRKKRLRVVDLASLPKCASLLIFTACWSGLGRTTVGDDVLGFSHAVLASGAAVFIGGLWELDALFAMLLMVTFARELAKAEPGTPIAKVWNISQSILYGFDKEKAIALLNDIIKLCESDQRRRSDDFKDFSKVADRLREDLEVLRDTDVAYNHPLYWAAYNMVGFGGLTVGTPSIKNQPNVDATDKNGKTALQYVAGSASLAAERPSRFLVKEEISGQTQNILGHLDDSENEEIITSRMENSTYTSSSGLHNRTNTAEAIPLEGARSISIPYFDPVLPAAEEHRFPLDIILSKLEYAVKSSLSSTSVGISVLRLLRPKLAPGYKRIEWTCSCGILLHGDYKVSSPASVLALNSLQQKLHASTVLSTNHGQTIRTSTLMQSGQSHDFIPRSTDVTSADIVGEPSVETLQFESSSLRRRGTNTQPTDRRTFLELCVNTATSQTVLEELPIRTAAGHDFIANDQSLFNTIRSIYFAARHKTSYRWLRAPTDIHFVKFSVAAGNVNDGSYRVSIFDRPKAFPTLDQVVKGRYESLDLSGLGVPIDSDTFIHFLTVHPRNLDQIQHTEWLPRFAKKCRESAKAGKTPLLRTSLQPEWGVRVIEGPNHWLFVLIISTIAVICILVGIVVAWKLGDTFKGLGGAAAVFGIIFAALNFFYSVMKDMGERT